MVRDRINPKTKDRFRKTARDVIKGLSRKVQVYRQPIRHECPNCYYDKLTSKSTGKCRWTLEEAETKQAEHKLLYPDQVRYKWFGVGRCPICKGAGYLETLRKAWAECLIIWNPEYRYGNEMHYTPAGSEGATYVQLKTDPKYHALFRDCTKIIVDGLECKLFRPPSLRGLGTQAILIVAAFTTSKPLADSGERIKDYT